jgi:two-component system nitrate/nitrite response regulator NarL
MTPSTQTPVSQTTPIRILLLDDHTLLRESLVRMLEPDRTLNVVGHCSTVAQACDLLATTPADLILLDYDLGHETGTDLLQFLQAAAHPARVLMLTAGMMPSATVAAFTAGVAGVVLKQSGTSQLIEAIHTVAAGGSWWGAANLRSALAGAHEAPESRHATRELTKRQRLVLRGILDGLSNKEIAANLEVSETAIKASIQELFTKAGVRTRSQLVRVALERFSTTWLQQ